MHFDFLFLLVFCCVMCKMRKKDVLLLSVGNSYKTPFFTLFRIVTNIVTPEVTSRKNLYTGRA